MRTSNPDIIIPTNKPAGEIKRLLRDIEQTAPGCRIVYTGYKASAATNRNWGLNHAATRIVVMVDDDIEGFTAGWVDRLIAPLRVREIVMASARLMRPDGKPGVMMDIKPDLSGYMVEVAEAMVPSACIAFRNDGTRFDECYEGAGFEDTDFCRQLWDRYPKGRFVICNTVKVVHRNEMKGQDSGRFQQNKEYYLTKWKLRKGQGS